MRTILLIALAQAASLATCCELRAEAPADSSGASQPPAQPTVQKPITREDAELMLREAHSAIEQGRFDDADKIISRVENAHVQFPFIHTGPTPASLRKELSRADRLRSASKSLSHEQPTGAKKYLPFSRSGSSQSNATTDPFAGRSRNDRTDLGSDCDRFPKHVARSWRSPVGQHLGAGLACRPIQKRRRRAQRSIHSLRPEHPAGPNGLPVSRANRRLRKSPLSYPSMHSATKDDSSQGRPSPAARPQTASTLPGSAESNPSWQLPVAPLPRGASDQQFGASGSGLDAAEATRLPARQRIIRELQPPRRSNRRRKTCQPLAKRSLPATSTLPKS